MLDDLHTIIEALCKKSADCNLTRILGCFFFYVLLQMFSSPDMFIEHTALTFVHV